MNKRTLLKAVCGIYRVKCAETVANTPTAVSDVYNAPQSRSCFAPENSSGMLGDLNTASSATNSQLVDPYDTPIRGTIVPDTPSVTNKTYAPVRSMFLTRDPSVNSFHMYPEVPSGEFGGLFSRQTIPKDISRYGKLKGMLPYGVGLWDVIMANQARKDLSAAHDQGDYVGSNGVAINSSHLTNAGLDVAAITSKALGYTNLANRFASPLLPLTAFNFGYMTGAGSVEDYQQSTANVRNGRGDIAALNKLVAEARPPEPYVGKIEEERIAADSKKINKEVRELQANPSYTRRYWGTPVSDTLLYKKPEGYQKYWNNAMMFNPVVMGEQVFDLAPRNRNEAKLIRNNFVGGMGSLIKGTGELGNWLEKWTSPMNWIKPRCAAEALQRYRNGQDVVVGCDPCQPMVDYGEHLRQIAAQELDGMVSPMLASGPTMNRETLASSNTTSNTANNTANNTSTKDRKTNNQNTGRLYSIPYSPEESEAILNYVKRVTSPARNYNYTGTDYNGQFLDEDGHVLPNSELGHRQRLLKARLKAQKAQNNVSASE